MQFGAEAADQLLPERGSVGAEHERLVGRADVPAARLDLVGELLRQPADKAGEKARLVRRAVDDAVDRDLVGRSGTGCL